jgi:hypothetical protein
MGTNGQRRAGWSCERGAVARGLSSPSQWSKANKLFEQMAILMDLDWDATIADVMAAKDRIAADILQARRRLQEYDQQASEREIQSLTRINEGRPPLKTAV